MTVRVLLALVLVACAIVAAAHDIAPSDPGPVQWEPDIVAFEARDAVAPPPRHGVLFIGSSSIRMWSTLAQDFPGVDVINRGFGGSSVEDATAYVDRIVLPYRPRAVFLYAGDNDLNEGDTPADVAAEFADFVDAVHAGLPDTAVHFIAIKPSPARRALLEKMRETNRLIAEYARTHDGVTFVDVFTPMLDANGEPDASLFIDDTLHMNARGYAIWRARIAPLLDPQAP